MKEITTEEIYFYPHNSDLLWPGVDIRTGAPFVILKVTYTDTGCMILDSMAFPRREMILFDSTRFGLLIQEVTDYVSRYNTLELC